MVLDGLRIAAREVLTIKLYVHACDEHARVVFIKKTNKLDTCSGCGVNIGACIIQIICVIYTAVISQRRISRMDGNKCKHISKRISLLYDNNIRWFICLRHPFRGPDEIVRKTLDTLCRINLFIAYCGWYGNYVRRTFFEVPVKNICHLDSTNNLETVQIPKFDFAMDCSCTIHINNRQFAHDNITIIIIIIIIL